MENLGNNFFNKENTSEKLDFKIEIATPDDWEICKNMRIKSLMSSDGEMLDSSDKKINEEKDKNEDEWRMELSDEKKLTMLPKNGTEVIGIGRAINTEKDIWAIYNGYIEKEFQNYGLGKALFQSRIDEIKRRGGRIVRLAVKNNNFKVINMAESFGFKKLNKISQYNLVDNKKSLITEQIMELSL